MYFYVSCWTSSIFKCASSNIHHCHCQCCQPNPQVRLFCANGNIVTGWASANHVRTSDFLTYVVLWGLGQDYQVRNFVNWIEYIYFMGCSIWYAHQSRNSLKLTGRTQFNTRVHLFIIQLVVWKWLQDNLSRQMLDVKKCLQIQNPL